MGRDYVGRPRVRWWCACDCGKVCSVDGGALRSGSTQSCGCFRLECAPLNTRKHGQHGTPEYRSWQGMWDRTQNRNSEHFKDYGERGIDVCGRWRDTATGFASFLDDMGHRPSPGHTIDRINNSLGYNKDNCRWATKTEQSRNRRTTRWLTAYGLRATLAQWEGWSGVKYSTLLYRIKVGWSPERIVAKAFTAERLLQYPFVGTTRCA